MLFSYTFFTSFILYFIEFIKCIINFKVMKHNNLKSFELFK